MRKYQISGVEHVHMMRRVPRSYDMTRTHIMHQSVNRHVDVVLRCSPKHWKTKKVPVTLVRGEKKNEAVRIRVHADKRYVAVRRVSNEKYEADRRKAAVAYETKYGQPSANNRALIHDMKSQLATMAQRSADYIDEQLRAGDPTMNIPSRRNAPQEAPLPAFPQVPETPSQPLLSPEVDDILRKGGYKRPASASANPYASDYLKQASDAEFHSLMDSLERSLDAAYDKYAVTSPAPAQESASQDDGDWGLHNLPSSDELGRNGGGADTAAWQPQEDFAPALSFRDGGEHYLPQDDLFGRRFTDEDDGDDGYFGDPDESYTDGGFGGTEEDYGERFDVSRFFADEEFDTPPVDSAVPSADFDEQESILSPRFAAQQPEEQTELPQGYTAYPAEEAPRHLYPDEEDTFVPPSFTEEEDTFALPPDYPAQDDDFALPPQFPQEEESFPPASAPTDGGVSYVPQTDEEEAEQPLMIFPDEDEEDEGPPIMFPDDDEEDSLPSTYPQDEGGYSPPPVSPDRNELWTGDADGDYATRTAMPDARQTETLFSRAGGQLKKAIGVIRGGGSRDDDDKDGYTPPYAGNGDIEITFSDESRR